MIDDAAPRKQFARNRGKAQLAAIELTSPTGRRRLRIGTHPNGALVLTAERDADRVKIALFLDPPEERRLADLLIGRGARTLQERTRANFDDVCGDDVTDTGERRDRFSEEAIELAQALRATREGMHALVDYVFDRPPGVPAQEMGGTLVTLAALASYAKLNMLECGEAELARCSTPAVIEKIRAKRSNRGGRGALPGVEGDLVIGASAQNL